MPHCPATCRWFVIPGTPSIRADLLLDRLFVLCILDFPAEHHLAVGYAYLDLLQRIGELRVLPEALLDPCEYATVRVRLRPVRCGTSRRGGRFWPLGFAPAPTPGPSATMFPGRGTPANGDDATADICPLSARASLQHTGALPLCNAAFRPGRGSAIQVMLSPRTSQKSPVDSAYCRLPFARQPYLDSTTEFRVKKSLFFAIPSLSCREGFLARPFS